MTTERNWNFMYKREEIPQEKIEEQRVLCRQIRA